MHPLIKSKKIEKKENLLNQRPCHTDQDLKQTDRDPSTTNAHKNTYIYTTQTHTHKQLRKMKKEDTVKLISSEGFEFVIDKRAAMVSQTIRNMLTSPGNSIQGFCSPLLITFNFIHFLIKLALYCWFWFVLLGSFSETEHRQVTFPEISTTILEKICQYFHWSLQYARFGLFDIVCRLFLSCFV